jgi:hypothetical protein
MNSYDEKTSDNQWYCIPNEETSIGESDYLRCATSTFVKASKCVCACGEEMKFDMVQHTWRSWWR